MKTVQDWQDQWHLGRLSLAELIAAIQADACRAGLLRAAEICGGKIWARGIHGAKLMRETIEAIEAEAKGGQ